ncbi:MAG TPA: hypothetical protein VGE43_19640 [Acidimicrobiales bacterium]
MTVSITSWEWAGDTPCAPPMYSGPGGGDGTISIELDPDAPDPSPFTGVGARFRVGIDALLDVNLAVTSGGPVSVDVSYGGGASISLTSGESWSLVDEFVPADTVITVHVVGGTSPALIDLSLSAIPGEPPPDPPSISGIRVGQIILGFGPGGLYHYTNGDEPFVDGIEWNSPFAASAWQGSRDGLTPGTGFGIRRVIATDTGTYAWTCTPLFAVDSGTTEVGVFIYDAVGDFLEITETRSVASGETISGSVALDAGQRVTFLVRDTADTPGQAVLDGSFWNFPYP